MLVISEVFAANAAVFGRPFIKLFARCYRTIVLSVLCVPSCLSVCDVGVLWPNGWMDQDETWHEGSPQPWPHCVRWGPSSPKRGTAPKFSAHVCCGQPAEWIKMPLGVEVGLSPSDIVLMGTQPPKKGQSPQFLAHVYCDQMARWIRMPLSAEVGLVLATLC